MLLPNAKHRHLRQINAIAIDLDYNCEAMKPSFRFRPLLALIVIFCMLFSQLALAAHACPALAISGASEMAMVSGDGFPHKMALCQDMDMGQPALCHAHADDQAAKQSLDKPDSPHVAPFVGAELLVVVTPIDLAHDTHAAPGTMLLPPATAPPIAIRNCCFRI